METKRLSKVTLLAYACGDFASNLCWAFIGSYLSIFYTDIVGMAPAVASAIMMIARIWDGVNDPMFGAIAERTNTKKGRFRPYIYYGAPFLALFSVLSFTTFGSGTTAVIWAAFSYIGCGMLYTVVNLSYGSLATVMTTDPKDIVRLNSWRMIGTNFSGVFLAMISAPLLTMFADKNGVTTASSYTKVAIIFAICALPLFYFCYAFCKETVKPATPGKKVPISTSIKTILTNKPLIMVFFLQMLTCMALFGRQGLVIYYVIYCVGNPSLIPFFMAIPAIMTVVGIAMVQKVVHHVGKKKVLTIALLGCAASLVAIYFAGRATNFSNVPLLLVLHGVYGLFCYTMTIELSMVPECIDYAEDKVGVRADGTSYAAVSLGGKLGNAFGVSIGLLIMGATGYVANTKQTSEALAGLNGTTNLYIAALFLLALIPLLFYPLNEKKNSEIRSRLDDARNSNN